MRSDNRLKMHEALQDLKCEVLKAMRIEEFLDWLAPRIPSWVDQLPVLPRWMGLMFWLYLVAGTKGTLLLAAYFMGYLK